MFFRHHCVFCLLMSLSLEQWGLKGPVCINLCQRAVCVHTDHTITFTATRQAQSSKPSRTQVSIWDQEQGTSLSALSGFTLISFCVSDSL